MNFCSFSPKNQGVFSITADCFCAFHIKTDRKWNLNQVSDDLFDVLVSSHHHQMLILFDNVIGRNGSSEDPIGFFVSENIQVIFNSEIYVLYAFLRNTYNTTTKKMMKLISTSQPAGFCSTSSSSRQFRGSGSFAPKTSCASFCGL